MILYIVYLLLLPVVIISVLLLSLINQKIRKNLINGFRTRVNARKHIKQNSFNKDIMRWKNDWGDDIYLNHGTSNSRGTLIAFSKEFDKKVLKPNSCKFFENPEKF